MSRSSFINPVQAERILDAYFGITYPDGSPVYPKYADYRLVRASGACLFSRKALTASAAPTQQKFFNGAPGAYTGNYKADGVLGDFFAIIIGVRVKLLPIAITEYVENKKVQAGGFITVKLGDTRDVWTKTPLHEVIDGPHLGGLSNITAAVTEKFCVAGGAGELPHDSFILYQPDEKFEVILDWDTTVYDTVTVANRLDCVIDYIAKTKN